MYVHLLVQAAALGQAPGGLGLLPAEAAAMAALGGLAILIYKLGTWREAWNHGLRDLQERIGRLEAEMSRRFEALESHIEDQSERRMMSERWQGGVEKTLELHERQIHGIVAFNQPEAG